MAIKEEPERSFKAKMASFTSAIVDMMMDALGELDEQYQWRW
jgi:hypothetical protein